MKRAIAAACLAVCAALWASAAGAQGLKLGLNISDFEGDDAGDWDTKLGFSVGAFMVRGLGHGLDLQTELLYTTKGAKVSGTFMGQDYETVVELAYLELPLLLRVSSRTASGKLGLLVGPFVGLNVSADSTTTVAGHSDTTSIEDDTTDLEAGLVFALAFEGRGVSGELRYTLGLTTIDEDGDTDVTNTVLSMMVGFTF